MPDVPTSVSIDPAGKAVRPEDFFGAFISDFCDNPRSAHAERRDGPFWFVRLVSADGSARSYEGLGPAVERARDCVVLFRHLVHGVAAPVAAHRLASWFAIGAEGRYPIATFLEAFREASAEMVARGCALIALGVADPSVVTLFLDAPRGLFVAAARRAVETGRAMEAFRSLAPSSAS
jgi:nucleotide-binding universal stress UspA family protein